LFFGAALGNVVRGVNLGGVVDGVSKFESIYFFNPLWNEYFSPLVPNEGILDWFTIILGVIAIVTLTIHGAGWIILKTNSTINKKLKNVISILSLSLIPLIIISIIAWLYVKPNAMENYFDYPVLWVFPLTVLIGLTGLFRANNFKKDSSAFIFSSVFIVGAFGSTVASLFPVLLPSSNSLNPSLTVYNASTSAYGLNVGIIWWPVAIILVIGYFYYVHKVFRGKVDDIEYH
jgi:cytochrome d ubiquinol oxidase subunit II